MGYFHLSSTSLPCSSLCPLLHVTVHCQSPGPSWCHELGAPQSPRLPSWMLFQPRPLPGASGRRISALLCTIGGGLPRFKTADAPDTMPSLLILDFQKPSGSAPPGTAELYSHNCMACLCRQLLLAPYWLRGTNAPLSLLLTCRGAAWAPITECFQFHHTFFLQGCLLQRFYRDKDEKIKPADAKEAHSPVEQTVTQMLMLQDQFHCSINKADTPKLKCIN